MVETKYLNKTLIFFDRQNEAEHNYNLLKGSLSDEDCLVKMDEKKICYNIMIEYNKELNNIIKSVVHAEVVGDIQGKVIHLCISK